MAMFVSYERWSWAQISPAATSRTDWSWLIFLALGINAILLLGLVFIGLQLQSLGRTVNRKSSEIQPLRKQVLQLVTQLNMQQQEINSGGQKVQQLESAVQKVQEQVEILRNPAGRDPYRGVVAAPRQNRPTRSSPFDSQSRAQVEPALNPSAIEEHINFYNRVLKLGNNTLIKEQIRSQWTSMRPMSMDMETYRVRRKVHLNPNNGGVFYGLSEDETLYEVFLDPGFSVEHEAVEAAFEIEGSGNYIGSIVEPALFVADGSSERLKLHKKGKLVAT
ncbi:DUF948 domain-containing protein [Gloeobacter violaceus]|nr:hypothetical protein [Gloeobacter violaceus]